jgi:hypothetical protein
MRIVWMFVAVLFSPVVAFAQTHPCDLTTPTSGTATAGQTATLALCHPGVDTNGNPVTGFAIYLDGARSTPTLTRGATANSAGLWEYTAPMVVPATAGLKTYESAALSGTLESPKSVPFVLTVTLPRTVPLAPTKTLIR